MKKNYLLILFCMFLSFGLFTQCEKYGKRDITPLADDGDVSEQPVWAGGNPDLNPNKKGNDQSGTTRGGDYGDLFVLLRDINGVPIMIEKEIEGDLEYFTQPIDAITGEAIELDQYGEIPPSANPIEVDFGRLNIVRSPQSVLDQAFEEAMKVLKTNGNIVVDEIKLDFCGRLTSYYTDNSDPINPISVVKTIDSPRENMAIYQYIMKNLFEPYLYEFINGVLVQTTDVNRLAFLGEAPYNFDPLIIAASCFAAGSDKTGTVDIDEVVYINGFVDCIGLNPILNEHDYDFSHEQNYYFNFSAPILGEAQFQYNRGVYEDRYLKIITLKGNGTYTEEIMSVKEAMEDKGLFTFEWGLYDYLYKVEGFAAAVDDAVQVLDYVHGDSNIEFLPDYEPTP